MKTFMKITSTLLACIIIFSICIFSTYAATIGDGKFTYQLNPSTKEATILEYVGVDTDVKVPSTFSGYTVTKLADSVFMKSSVKSVILPNTLKKLGNGVFEGCTSLVECVLPNSITEIGKELFRGCTSLTNVTFNFDIANIPVATFLGCTSLTTVHFNSPVKNIGASAFYKCTSFSDASILSEVYSVSQSSFANTAIKSIEFSENITTIPAYSFNDNKLLTTVSIPKNITEIDSTAFMNCNNLTIKCYKDTVAHNFAVDNNIPYILYDSYDLGDVDLSGGIDIKDATLIQKHLADIDSLDDNQLSVADFNEDGQINIMDATAIQKYLVS